MKRIYVASLAALSLLLLCQHQASAYSKFKFGIGFNISWEGANNSILCGLIRGGPGPGSPSDPYPGYADGVAAGPYSPGMAMDGFGAASINPPGQVFTQASAPSVAQPVSYFNYNQQGYAGYPQTGTGDYQQTGYGYPQTGSGDYQQTGYGYPQTDYSGYPQTDFNAYYQGVYGSGYQTPSYWYGK